MISGRFIIFVVDVLFITFRGVAACVVAALFIYSYNTYSYTHF